MREVVILGLGQAGTQLSNATWELLCLEHAVKPDGRLFDGVSSEEYGHGNVFFQESHDGQYIPRTVIVDLEPSVVDEVRSGVYRNLFHPDQLITGLEDASNNFARGFYTVGRKLIDKSLTQIRKAVEACDMFQGFFVVNGVGGGTGSGFTSLALSHLSTEYAKRSKVQVAIYPGPRLGSSTVEPYNAVLTFSALMQQTELTMLLDNEALYEICDKHLNILQPTYTDINRIISTIFSCLTVSLRFPTCLNADLTQLETNLVPYPRIHFAVVSHAPIKSPERAEHEVTSVSDLTRMLFEPSSQMLTLDFQQTKAISCCIQYRGDIVTQEVNRAILEMKQQRIMDFVDWCPTGFKLGISSQPPTVPSVSPMAKSTRSATMLMNTSAMNQALRKVDSRFDLLFHKRSFVHWFVSEGMEEGEFYEAREEMATLERDYLEVVEPTPTTKTRDTKTPDQVDEW